MANFCLIKPLAEKFKQALRDGTIDPVKLSEMTSKDRHAFLEGIVGKDSAAKVNSLFESKLLLKDTQTGMIQWAKQLSGIKPEVRNRLIDRIERMDERILDPKEQEKFMEDLAESRLGTEVTFEEAKTITELSKRVRETRENVANDRLSYGMARVDLENFLNDIKRQNEKMTFEDIKINPAGSALKSVSNVAGFAKSLKASLDLSAIGRQGFKTIFTHPKQWASNSVTTFKNAVRQLGHKASDETVMNGVKADVYSRENALNGNYERMKLDIGKGEEAYPTSLPERIPGLGRLFKASEVGYQGFLTKLRADIADKYIEVALKNGIDLKDPLQAQSIGRLVNSLTGRGNLGSFENAGKTMNTLFFSPKNVKAQFDFLTLHAGEKMSPFARKQAAINLIKVTAGVATILGIAKALYPDSVEEDPRSADFGKIRVGDTRFDVSGGMSSMMTLAARIASMSSKSSSTNEISELGFGFGQKSPIEVLYNFGENKLSPFASLIRNLINRTDREGNPLTVKGELANLLLPLPVSNAKELYSNPNAAPMVVALLADALGIATNTYAVSNKKSGIIPENQKISNDDFIKSVMVYAKAIGEDPETAFNRIFSGQKIRRVDNGTIIVERMSLKDSTAVKKKANANTPEMKLDHTIPLQLGGSNDEKNLKLVKTSEWKKYTPVENKLGRLLKAEKISKKEAQELITKFKSGEIKAETILEMDENGKQSSLKSGLGNLASNFSEFNRKKGELITGGLKKIADYQKGNNDLFLAGMKQDMERTNALARGETYDKPINKEAQQVYNDSLMNVAGTTSGVNTGKALAKVPLKKLSGLGNVLKSKLDDVLVEAKEYKNVDDFIKSQTAKEYRSAHQIDTVGASPITKLGKDKIDEFVQDFKNQYGYPSLKSKDLNKLKAIIDNPNKEVTIYRASPRNEINTGDWVTIDRDYANDIKRQNGGKVFSFKVKASDLYYPNTLSGFKELPSLNKWGAFQYQPEELVSKLTDIWNKANK